MASPISIYQKEMHDNLGYFATWLPGDSIELGDIGVLTAGRFRKLSSLKELGINQKAGSFGKPRSVQYSSTSSTHVSAAGTAKVKSLIEGEIKIEFSEAGAFLFHASGLRDQKLEERTALWSDIVRFYEMGIWKREWLLIEAIYVADNATILVSQDQSAELVLAAKSKLPLTAVQLADPDVNLAVASQRGRLVQVLGGKNLHPLYTCVRLKDPLVGSPRVDPVRGPTSSIDHAEATLTHPGLRELLES